MSIRFLCIGFLCCLGAVTQAQPAIKIAHISSNELLAAMPEMQKANIELEAYAKTWRLQYDALNKGYTELVKDYQANEKTMGDSIRTSRAAEGTALQNQLQSIAKQAEDSLQKRRENLYKPIMLKANATIAALAQEKGYDYVVDSNTGAIIYLKKETNDLLPAAKLRLKTNK